VFTAEEIEIVIALRKSGMSITQVAELYATDRIVIRKIESNYYKEARNG
jgi:hypothetical protein